MNDILHLQHGTRFSWNRDFLSLDDLTGHISSIKLNMLQRILRITLGSLAYLIGLNVFFAKTILSQKRITPFEQTKNSHVAVKIEILVCALEGFGKKLSFKAPVINPFLLPSELKNPREGESKDRAQEQKIARLTNFFPDAIQPLPKDVLSLLLSWLDFKDVSRMRQVNRSWNQLICDMTKSLTNKFIDSCYAEATKVLVNTPIVGDDHGNIFRGFTEILKSLVKYDIEATKSTLEVAKQMALKLERHCRDYLLREIAQVEAHYDIETAKQTIATIRAGLWRNQAIFYITLHIEKNFPRAKELALGQGAGVDYKLRDIVRIEAETDIPSALMTLPLIQNLDVRAQAHVYIIKRQAQTDLPGAKVSSAALENPRFRYQAELAIAQLDPAHNFQPVIATALTIVYDEWDSHDLALAQIAVIQNQFDKKGAQETLALISHDSPHLNQVIEMEAKSNIKTAMHYLLRTGKQYNYRLQLIFLSHIVRKNMWEAKTLAHSFGDLEKKVYALTKLAEFAIKENRVAQATSLPLQNFDG